MTKFVRCNANHSNGDWGAEWSCELEKGHTGPHQVAWEDDYYPYKDKHGIDMTKKDTYHITLSWVLEKGGGADGEWFLH